MSKLKEKLSMLNKEVVATGTLELNEESVKTAEPDWNEMQQEKRDNMQLSDSQVMRDYPDPKYHNQSGMVSPLNIILMDHVNTIYNMPIEEAKQFILDNIEALNSKYSGDPFYDTFSEASGGYFRKLKYNMDNLRPNTIDNLIMLLQNTMMQGMTNLKRRRAVKNFVKQTLAILNKK